MCSFSMRDIAGSEEAFAEMMNEKAAEIGMDKQILQIHQALTTQIIIYS